MAEYLIVALIVGASAWYAGRKYLPVFKKRSGGCGSGCGSCNSCGDPAPASERVITVHRKRDRV